MSARTRFLSPRVLRARVLRGLTAISSLGLALLAVGCIGGSATETTGGAKLTGRVLYSGGTPVAGATLEFRAAVWPGDSAAPRDTGVRAEAVTRKDGSYHLDSLASGEYLVLIRDAKGNLAMGEFSSYAEKPRQTRPADTLFPPGGLSGSLGVIRGEKDTGVVELYGLGRTVRADSAGNFEIGNLPAGKVKVRAVSSRVHWTYADTTAIVIPADTVAMAPFTPVVNEDYSTWAHKKKVLIQTDEAGVNGDVYDFPVALRITGGILPFSQTDSKDLRFADAKGRHLPYAIESWDPAGDFILVWVHLDTIKGNTKQSIWMYWGNPGAPDMSDSRAVFGGFSGVWHLGDSIAADGAGKFQDASPNGGEGSGKTRPGGNQGILGRGQGFQLTHSITVAGSATLKPAGGLCISAWVRMDGMDSLGGEIATLGESYGLRAGPDGHIRFYLDHGGTSGFTDLDAGDTASLADGNWHLVTGTYDGQIMRVFLDGGEHMSTGPRKPLAYSRGNDFHIGAHGEGAPGWGFKGNLDEIQVSPMARTPAWLRLQFENQRLGVSALIAYTD